MRYIILGGWGIVQVAEKMNHNSLLVQLRQAWLYKDLVLICCKGSHNSCGLVLVTVKTTKISGQGLPVYTVFKTVTVFLNCPKKYPGKYLQRQISN